MSYSAPLGKYRVVEIVVEALLHERSAEFAATRMTNRIISTSYTATRTTIGQL
ncbi:hypothetical protein QQ054_14980 [Oscillatoria amoena NRMC-F 0135]|nr:hypothetical protein [Oscillatoria amoena NRMC-F 0135]